MYLDELRKEIAHQKTTAVDNHELSLLTSNERVLNPVWHELQTLQRIIDEEKIAAMAQIDKLYEAQLHDLETKYMILLKMTRG
jgi:hypothetical protein